MNTLVHFEFLTPAALSVIDLVLASALHQAVVRDLGLLQRRRLFESLSLLGLLVALLVALTNFLLWRANPVFVVLCNAVWVTFCGALIVILLRRRHSENDDIPLEIPGMQSDGIGTPSVAASSGARPPPSRAPLSPRRLRANLDVYRRSALRDESSATVPRNLEHPSAASRRTPNRRTNIVRARRERVEPS